MPNRILRDWTDSKKIEMLKWQEEVLLTRLIMKVDDYGNFDADPLLVKSLCFPRKDGLRVSDVTVWLENLHAAGLIRFYQVNGNSFLHLRNFKQRLDRAKRKYPNEPLEFANESVADDNEPMAETKRSRNRNEVETETEPPAAAPDFEKKLVLKNPFSEKFLETWVLWKNFKKSEFKFLFKSIESEQASLNDLVEKSTGDEQTAVKIVHQSMANGWKGLFKLKNEDNESANGKAKGKSTNSGLYEVFAKRYGEREA